MSDTIERDSSLDVKSMMENRQNETQTYEHGDYVPGENGEAGGIVIDPEAQLRKTVGEDSPMLENVQKYLNNQKAQIENFNHQKIENSTVEQDKIARSGATDKPELEKVARAFSQFEMGPNGLVSAGSKEAEIYKDKMDKLSKGEVDLNAYENVKPEQIIPAKTPQQYQQMKDAIDVESTPVVDSVVQFNVPAEKTSEFISTLDIKDREKVQKTNTIVVNEVSTLKVPVATRVITSMDEYKRIAPRTINSEVKECVLLNSGYIATVKGSGSLAMATLIPDQPNSIDYNKRFQFCYDNLVNTSIGKLSYQEFITNTALNDLDTLLYTILQASDPDENKITLQCGVTTCRKEYEVDYKLSELLDTDKITDEVAERINSIVEVRDMYDKAKTLHNDSAVMTRKLIEIKNPLYPDRTTIIEIKSPDASIAIERYALLNDISEQYSRLIMGMLLYVPRVYDTFAMDDESEPSTYEINDAFVIADIIGQLNDAAIQAISDVVEEMNEFAPMTYSFKGEFKCPYCGRIEHQIACQIDQLIFYKVGRAMR